MLDENPWKPFEPWRSLRGVLSNYRHPSARPALSAGARAKSVSILEARRLARQGALFVYPEVVLGNPYQAAHVLRWLLHFPMFHRGGLYWSTGDWVVRFNDAVPPICLPGVRCPETFLKVVRYPIASYVSKRQVARSGSAYLVRKGVGKPFIHPADAICIDGLGHEEAAEILGRVERFYSYDIYTAYSYFAAIAGSLSIVVPDAGWPIERWYASEEDRWGVAYGEERVDWARSTEHLVLPRLQAEEQKSLESVRAFFASLECAHVQGSSASRFAGNERGS